MGILAQKKETLDDSLQWYWIMHEKFFGYYLQNWPVSFLLLPTSIFSIVPKITWVHFDMPLFFSLKKTKQNKKTPQSL